MNQKFRGSLFSKPRDYQKKRRSFCLVILMVVTAVALIAAPISTANAQTAGVSQKTLRIGYFPNITHSQAVIGLNNGDFQKALGEDVTVETFRFNAGPSAIESLLADRIDVTYIGPNPAINGYLLSGGEDVRVISGASSGGASFVVRNDSGIESVNDLGGKKFASPQLGNTQDVALRKYLVDNGFNTVENGGNVTVLPIANADILTVFLKGEIDGAWVPEPWATRLIQEAGGKVLLDERDLWPDGKFVTGNIIVRTDYLRDNPDVIKKLLEAHVDETLWINEKITKTNNTNVDSNNESEIVSEFNNGLKNITGKTYPANQLGEAFSRIEFTLDPLPNSLIKIAEDASELGFIKRSSNWNSELANIHDLTLLNEVLIEKGLQSINK
jgi:NitT/TauT family transport system substrate-binding protein